MPGIDRPQYTNIAYPIPFDPPYVPVENPTGLYTRSFSWRVREGRRAYLVLEGVDAAFYLFVNGELSGYSEIPHSTAEFDITPYLREGENQIHAAVLKWCKGTYLDDQDKIRLSGIFRDVYLLDRPEGHLADYTVRTCLRPRGNGGGAAGYPGLGPGRRLCPPAGSRRRDAGGTDAGWDGEVRLHGGPSPPVECGGAGFVHAANRSRRGIHLRGGRAAGDPHRGRRVPAQRLSGAFPRGQPARQRSRDRLRGHRGGDGTGSAPNEGTSYQRRPHLPLSERSAFLRDVRPSGFLCHRRGGSRMPWRDHDGAWTL